MKTEMYLSDALTKVWYNKADYGSYSSIYLSASLRTVASIYEMELTEVYRQYENIDLQLSGRKRT